MSLESLEDEMEHHFAQIMLHMHLVYANQVLLKDIKTQNIFLTKDHAVMKIGDFCISKIFSSKSKAYTVVVTNHQTIFFDEVMLLESKTTIKIIINGKKINLICIFICILSHFICNFFGILTSVYLHQNRNSSDQILPTRGKILPHLL